MVAVLLLLLLHLLVGGLLLQSLANAERRSDQIAFRADLTSLANRVTAALTAASGAGDELADHLAAHLGQSDGTLSQEDWNGLAASHVRHIPLLRNLGLSEGFKIAFVFPSAGNQSALGLDYRKIPTQWPGVAQTYQTRNGLMTGPIPLAQGTQAMIYRVPVFRRDQRPLSTLDDDHHRTPLATLPPPLGPDELEADPAFFGILSLVLDQREIEKLLFRQSATATEGGVLLALGIVGKSGGETDAVLIAGSPRAMSAQSEQITLPIAGQNWTLFAQAPFGGSSLTSSHMVLVLSGLAVLFIPCAVLLAVSLRSLRQRYAIEDQLTEALREASTAQGALTKARDTLSEAEKLAGLGSLVSAIGRELTGPLGSGITATSHLEHRAKEFRPKLDKPKRSEVQHFIDDVESLAALANRTAQRSAALIESFRSIAEDLADNTSRSADLGGYLMDIRACLIPSLRIHAIDLEVSCPEGITINGPMGLLFRTLSEPILLRASQGGHKVFQLHATLAGPDRVRLTLTLPHAELDNPDEANRAVLAICDQSCQRLADAWDGTCFTDRSATEISLILELRRSGHSGSRA
ncbi:MAG: CHASE domain-containing protein [Rhodospirillaceae bacterium]